MTAEPRHSAAQLRELGRRLGRGWTAERAQKVRDRLEAQLRDAPPASRRNLRAHLGFVIVAAAVLAMVGGWYAWRPGPSDRQASRPAEIDPAVQVTALSAATTFTDEQTAEARVYRLQAGHARFRVEPGRPRPVRVQAGSVVVEVVGTRFDVLRLDAERATVRVAQGRVRVRWPGGKSELGPGEEGTFPPGPARLPRDEPSAPEPEAPSAAAPRPRDSWRSLAESGHYQAAYEALDRDRPAIEGPTDLLLAADAARLSGHPDRAVPLLRRVVRDFSDHGQAPLAAFTLGRVLLDELGRAGEAADAFAQARRQGGLLAEDALAREALARWQAGQAQRARSLAGQYLEVQPQGRWTSQLQGLLDANPGPTEHDAHEH